MADVLPVATKKHAIRRALMAVAAGVVAYGVSAPFVVWQAAILIGWDAMAGVFVGSTIAETWTRDPERTATLATREDDSRATADLLLVSASVVSLGGIAFGLVKAGQLHGPARAGMTAAVVLSVFLAWLVVQSVYTVRYAALYYRGAPGGIDFNDDEPPDYHDFAYVALTMGMTYQVSDTNLGTKDIRRTATRHALLSYLFGTVVVAVMINVVASLLH